LCYLGGSDLEDIPFEEGREIIMVESKEKNDTGKDVTFIENESLEILTVFPAKLPDLGSFSIPSFVGMVEIERVLCDLSACISLMPYSLFHGLHLGSL